jgi:hypothetical protein
MKTRLVKVVTGLVIGGLISFAASGIATANQIDKVVATTHTAAAQLQYLHDQIQSAMQGKNVQGVSTNVDTLRPIFKALKGAPLARAATEQTFKADGLAAHVQRELPGLGGLPDPIAIVTNLLQTLLGTVLDLVSGLLGSVPLPLPELPGLPGLPLPGLPLPLPLPGLPGADPGAVPAPAPLPLPLPAPPAAPEVPEAPAAPEAPEAPEAPAVPEAPEAPEAPAAPEAPVEPAAPLGALVP